MTDSPYNTSFNSNTSAKWVIDTIYQPCQMPLQQAEPEHHHEDRKAESRQAGFKKGQENF
jgi:hypothetical protein